MSIGASTIRIGLSVILHYEPLNSIRRHWYFFVLISMLGFIKPCTLDAHMF